MYGKLHLNTVLRVLTMRKREHIRDSNGTHAISEPPELGEVGEESHECLGVVTVGGNNVPAAVTRQVLHGMQAQA